MTERQPRSLLAASVLAASMLAAQAQPVAGEERVARIYDLRELVTAGPPVAAPRLGLGDGRGPVAESPPSGPAAIARLVGAFVVPPLRDNEVVQPLGERWIVVLGRPEQHAWTDRFLEAARTRRTHCIGVESRLFTMPELTFQQEVAPVLRPEPAPGTDPEPAVASEPSTVVLAPGAGTRAFFAALEKLDAVTDTDLPAITLTPLTPGHVTTLNQTAYVRDFEVEIAQGTVIADPIVDVVQDGIAIETAAVLLDADYVGLSLDVQVADLKRPIPTFETRLGAAMAPVTIQLPQLTLRSVEAAVRLPPGHTVVVVLPAMAGVRYMATLEVGLAGK